MFVSCFCLLNVIFFAGTYTLRAEPLLQSICTVRKALLAGLGIPNIGLLSIDVEDIFIHIYLVRVCHIFLTHLTNFEVMNFYKVRGSIDSEL